MFAIAGIEVTEVAMAVAGLRAAFTAYRLQAINDFNSNGISAQDNSQFHKVFYFQESEISSEAASILLQNQEVICVKRCCYSSTGMFPSGLISIVTWAVFAQTVRHEYVIVYTTDYVILIELKEADNQVVTKIVIQRSLANDRNKTESAMTEDKWYSRDLAVVKGNDLETLKIDQIFQAIDAWILINRNGSNKFIFQQKSKSLARTIRYFVKRQHDDEKVLESALGIFTDKPGMAVHIDMVLIETLALKGARLVSNNIRQAFDDGRRMFEAIRTGSMRFIILE